MRKLHRYRERYGLLVNDSLTLALAEPLGMGGLATAARDILRLGGELPFPFLYPGDLSAPTAGLSHEKSSWPIGRGIST